MKNIPGQASIKNKSKVTSRLIGILFLVTGLFLMREIFAESMAEVLVMIPPAPEEHEIALRLASGNSGIQSWVGAYYMLSTTGRDTQKALEHYKTAVELSPTYYLYWGQLGAAYEMEGNLDLAEQSYRNMVNLSPSFSQSHWVLANCLLRKGDLASSLSEFKRFLEIDPGSCIYVYDLLRQAKGITFEDIANSVVPSSGTARPRFAIFAADHSETMLAVATFQSIPRDEYERQRDYGILLIKDLIYQKHFDEARTIWNSYAPDSKEIPMLLVNGSFERAMTDYPDGFGWKAPEPLTGNLTITSDDGHSSKVSVRVDLTGRKSKSPARLLQLIAPISNGRYVLSYFCKGVNFTPPALPIVQVLDVDGKLIASDQPLMGSNDWTRRQIEIVAPPGAHSLVIAISSPAIAAYAEIANGQILFDDFSLERIN